MAKVLRISKSERVVSMYVCGDVMSEVFVLYWHMGKGKQSVFRICVRLMFFVV